MAMDPVQASFDCLAGLETGAWDHNKHYYQFLLSQIPARMDTALDIGCGTGEFARQLACRANSVTAVDFSGEMIRLARERSQHLPHVGFVQADIRDYLLPEAAFDCAVSIATFHHLPHEETLARVAAALRPGGVLAVLDLYKPDSLADYAIAATGAIAACILRFRKGVPSLSEEHRRAWHNHEPYDTYITPREIREIAARILPGAVIRRHILWRYSLVWRKP